MATHRVCFVIALVYQIISITVAINIAVNKPTVQSSTWYHDVSSRAVDGNTDNNSNQGSCSHTRDGTAGSQSWWCINLQAVYNNISYIKVYNRDILQERLQGFIIKTSSSGECDESGFTSATTCYTDTTDQQNVYTIKTCNQASTIFISVPVTKPLTLCEVKVITECTAGFYSDDCNITCSTNCQPGGCNQQDGRCNNGCTEGWYDDTCDTECNQQCIGGCGRDDGKCSKCPSGSFGDLCEMTCKVTNCQGNCNRVSGECSQCNNGWHGSNCQSACNDGCVNKLCTKSDGHCTSGCNKGKYADQCNIDCEQVGCLEGYTGPTCHQKVEEGISPSVTGIIGFICGILVTVILVVLIYIFYYKRKWTRKPTTGTERGFAYDNRSGSGIVTNRPGEYQTFDGDATTANSPASTNSGVPRTGTSTETTYDSLDMTTVTDHQPNTYVSLVKDKDYINYPIKSKLDTTYINE